MLKKLIFKKHINNKGMGLVEVIAALGISVIAITSLVSLAIYTMRLSLQTKLDLLGTQTATRERELVRAFRDRSATWEAFTTAMADCEAGEGDGCSMNADDLSVVAAPTVEAVESGINLTRGFDIETQTDPNIVYVRITVGWTIGGKVKSTHLYTYLSNWRNE